MTAPVFFRAVPYALEQPILTNLINQPDLSPLPNITQKAR